MVVLAVIREFSAARQRESCCRYLDLAAKKMTRFVVVSFALSEQLDL
jgi:hypothetical protein